VPIYEYVCEECGRLTEVMQRLGDPSPASCAECGATRLARVVSRTSFQLKGGGWYSDLYASQKKKPDGPAPGATPAGAAAATPGTPAPATGSGSGAPAAGAVATPAKPAVSSGSTKPPSSGSAKSGSGSSS
jgi:putative FmdB family regulatory protein